MKTKRNLLRLSIVIVLLLNTYSILAQDYVYVKATFDPSNAFGIMDNPRTKVESIGFDYDVEIGARHKWMGVYAFWGAFNEINYRNYGAGVDFYPDWFNKTFDLSMGIHTGVILRQGYGYNNEKVWGAYLAPGVRGVASWYFFKNLGITATANLQHRADIGKLAIFEGHIGLIFKRNNTNKRFR
tara:strand:+ start:2043 stop:2594 length:552 start_codon:yes stop_codon:yes gene_type:complete